MVGGMGRQKEALVEILSLMPVSEDVRIEQAVFLEEI